MSETAPAPAPKKKKKSSPRPKQPTKSGARYSDEEIRQTVRFTKLKGVMQHSSDKELIRIVRKDITTQWERIEQKKINKLTEEFLQKLANRFDIRGGSYTIDIKKHGGVEDYIIKGYTAPRRR